MSEKSECEMPYRIESGISYVWFIETKFFIEEKDKSFGNALRNEEAYTSSIFAGS